MKGCVKMEVPRAYVGSEACNLKGLSAGIIPDGGMRKDTSWDVSFGEMKFPT